MTNVSANSFINDSSSNDEEFKKIVPKGKDEGFILKVKENKAKRLNTCIYVDYENIFKQLNKMGTSPKKLDFFGTIKRYLESEGLNIIDFIIYSNFDDIIFGAAAQSELQKLGLQTRHTANKGKNSGDLEMTVDALKTLYKNNYIDVFVIISCDRDFIPLIKAIKAENKVTYVISTKKGFNTIVATFADEHSYIDDLFSEKLLILPSNQVASELSKVEITTSLEKCPCDLPNETIEKYTEDKAISLCKNLFEFKYWKEYRNGGDLVSVKGFTTSMLKRKGRTYTREDLNKLLSIAEQLEYIKLRDDDNKTYIEENTKTNELMKMFEQEVKK